MRALLLLLALAAAAAAAPATNGSASVAAAAAAAPVPEPPKDGKEADGKRLAMPAGRRFVSRSPPPPDG